MTAPTVREVVAARKQYLLARETYQLTGDGLGEMGGAYARWKSLERHCAHSTTKPSRHNPDLTARVAGIPCGVVVTNWGLDLPAINRADPADSHPPEYEAPEWFLVDRQGYAALWLERKMTPKEMALIDDMVLGGVGNV